MQDFFVIKLNILYISNYISLMEDIVDTQEYHTSKELLSNKEPDVIFFPTIKERSPNVSFVNSAWSYFNPERFRYNLEAIESIINGINVDSLSDERKKEFEKARDALLYAKAYENRVGDFQNARQITDTLSERMPQIVKPEIGEVTLSDIEQYAKDRLQTSTKNVVFLSNSHVSTEAEISALKEINPNTKIGLVVLDRHVDCYGGIPDGGLLKAKSNFVSFLLQDGKIEGVAFVGFPSEDRAKMLEGGSSGNNLSEVFKAFPDKITIANEDNYLIEQEGKKAIDYEKYVTEIMKQAELLKRVGVTNIVFSIDPDVLRLEEYGYTSMDYNFISPVLSLGIQDFSSVEEVVRKELVTEGIEQTPQIVADRLNEKILRSIYNPAYKVEEARGNVRGNPKHVVGFGLPLKAVGVAIDTVKAKSKEIGMEIGVKLPMGGRYLGDITELSGPDYKGRTARAVEGVISRISNPSLENLQK